MIYLKITERAGFVMTTRVIQFKTRVGTGTRVFVHPYEVCIIKTLNYSKWKLNFLLLYNY